MRTLQDLWNTLSMEIVDDDNLETDPILRGRSSVRFGDFYEFPADDFDLNNISNYIEDTGGCAEQFQVIRYDDEDYEDKQECNSRRSCLSSLILFLGCCCWKKMEDEGNIYTFGRSNQIVSNDRRPFDNASSNYSSLYGSQSSSDSGFGKQIIPVNSNNCDNNNSSYPLYSHGYSEPTRSNGGFARDLEDEMIEVCLRRMQRICPEFLFTNPHIANYILMVNSDRVESILHPLNARWYKIIFFIVENSNVGGAGGGNERREHCSLLAFYKDYGTFFHFDSVLYQNRQIAAEVAAKCKGYLNAKAFVDVPSTQRVPTADSSVSVVENMTKLIFIHDSKTPLDKTTPLHIRKLLSSRPDIIRSFIIDQYIAAKSSETYFSQTSV